MAPPPPRELLAVFEAALLGPAPPSPSQRVELLHAVRDAAPAFRALLSFPVRSPVPDIRLVVC
jgi:nuclear pore complex protein Nup205